MNHLMFLIVLFFVSTSKVQAFTGTYGINYGTVADNIPSPDKVITLLKAAKIRNVRIYDADHTIIKAFKGSGLNLVIGLPNQLLKDFSDNEDHAMTWVKQNVQPFSPESPINGIAIGNEVLGVESTELCESLLGAAKNIYNSIKKIGLADSIQISTSHSQAVFDKSFPPSACVFKDDVLQYMKPLLEFFSQIGSPFCLNAYPFLAYISDPETINLNYTLFEPNKGVYDEKNHLHYDNMLDAQIDAAYAALEDAGFGKMDIIVTETGWASSGDDDQGGANVDNARMYNYNLRKRLAKRKGTPLRPEMIVKAYVFAMFNEDLKSGPTSERNFGLFKADGSVAYDVGFRGLESSSSVDSCVLSLKVLMVCAMALFLFLRF